MNEHSLDWNQYPAFLDKAAPEIEPVKDPADRCIVFLRSGRTVKVPYSLQDLIRLVNETSTLLLEIDGCAINVDAIDSIEPVSRINREEAIV
jgi:hypothetical protein